MNYSFCKISRDFPDQLYWYAAFNNYNKYFDS